jgi:hypothetical protein
MYTDITEALLEMHYYQVFRALVQDHLGREVLRILKPSTNEEAFLGFDQGFARCHLSSVELRQQLREAIESSSTAISPMYMGYFLQYKRPEILVRKHKKTTPAGFDIPYYRFELKLEPSKVSGISQHETLLRLQQIRNADVSYACPMLFVEDDLYREPDLNDVRVVSLSTAPSGYSTNERHFVAFRTRDDENPDWCSEPTRGKSLSLPDWFRGLRIELMTPGAFLEWYAELSRFVVGLSLGSRGDRYFLPPALTILELGQPIEQGPANQGLKRTPDGAG